MVTSIATLITSAVAALSLLLALIQYWKKNQSDHAVQVLEMLDRTRKDDDIVSFIRLVDYAEYKGWYNEQFHNNRKMEKAVDNALHYYEYVLYLKQARLLKESEFHFFEYDITRIVGSEDVINYFFNLFHGSGRLSFKYERLLEYGCANTFINREEFHNKKSKQYKHVLF